MNIIFWIKGHRGLVCLKEVLRTKYSPLLLVIQPIENTKWYRETVKIAQKYKIPFYTPANPNTSDFEAKLIEKDADLFVLAGYGKILKKNIISIPKKMCINLHAGKLPHFKGSSPLNWVIIRGEPEFGLSIIRVDKGIDTGDIVLERSFEIKNNYTIKELHAIANKHFPKMLLEVLKQIDNGTNRFKKQNVIKGAYFPLRFPEDGLVLWDMFTAEEIHNRIRALTDPYPCAYTYLNNRMVQLLDSELMNTEFYGEPGRIYRKTEGKLTVCASDKCLLINKAIFADNGEAINDAVNLYDRFATIRYSIEEFLTR